MDLPVGFQFSQSNLQDFADCRRRFLLRSVQQLAWPAVESEPYLENERFLEQGRRFHQMAHQYFLGVPVERITALAGVEALGEWWSNLLKFIESNPAFDPAAGGMVYPEVSLSATIKTETGDGLQEPSSVANRLVAKYDMIHFDPEGKVVIYDWKTARRRPKRPWLQNRVQTRVYPYLLVRAGAFLNGGQPAQPEQIQMVYWFSAAPERPERFFYSAAQYAEDEAYLAGMAATIHQLSEDQFLRTEDERRCITCVYRSLCERGVSAGELDDASESYTDEDWNLLTDYDQIAEIVY